MTEKDEMEFDAFDRRRLHDYEEAFGRLSKENAALRAELTTANEKVAGLERDKERLDAFETLTHDQQRCIIERYPSTSLRASIDFFAIARRTV